MKRKIVYCSLYVLILLFFSGCPGNETKMLPENSSGGTADNNPQVITGTPAPVLSLAPTTVPTPTTDPNQIASYSTTLYDKNEHRVNNIKTAAEDINHTVVQPGDVFSFNDTVGKRTKEKGYEEAPILVNGEKEKGTGGGVCQLSSTIYNAALDADMKILERHSHSKKVPYVPEGKDAAVVYPSKDMRFKNTKDYPVEILVAVSGEEITVKLFKKKASG